VEVREQKVLTQVLQAALVEAVRAVLQTLVEQQLLGKALLAVQDRHLRPLVRVVVVVLVL
jgi:hypothetical protein